MTKTLMNNLIEILLCKCADRLYNNIPVYLAVDFDNFELKIVDTILSLVG